MEGFNAAGARKSQILEQLIYLSIYNPLVWLESAAYTYYIDIWKLVTAGY